MKKYLLVIMTLALALVLGGCGDKKHVSTPQPGQDENKPVATQEVTKKDPTPTTAAVDTPAPTEGAKEQETPVETPEVDPAEAPEATQAPDPTPVPEATKEAEPTKAPVEQGSSLSDVKKGADGRFVGGDSCNDEYSLGKYVTVKNIDGYSLNLYLKSTSQTSAETESYNGADGGVAVFEEGDGLQVMGIKDNTSGVKADSKLRVCIAPANVELKKSFDNAAWKHTFVINSDEYKSWSKGKLEMTIDKKTWAPGGFFNVVFAYNDDVIGYIPVKYIEVVKNVAEDKQEVSEDGYSGVEELKRIGLTPNDLKLTNEVSKVEVDPECCMSGYCEYIITFDSKNADRAAYIDKLVKELIAQSDNGKLYELDDDFLYGTPKATTTVTGANVLKAEYGVQFGIIVKREKVSACIMISSPSESTTYVRICF
ncbi:MAG: hypothetical protein MJ124_05165 [Lachnospiraceae bacterium]|nr:hypothetical protein [Lachnospiraceae bacterium]